MNVTTASQAAIRHYDRAVDAHLHAWPGVFESVEAATAEDPDFALARDALARVVEHASQYPTDVLSASTALGAYGLFAFSGLAAVRADWPALAAALPRLEALGERGHAGALVAVRWAQALIALVDGDRATAREHLDACSDDADRLGGSHAQRCVVEQTRDALRLPTTELSRSGRSGKGCR